MDFFERKYSLQPGDVLVRNKSVFGIIDHYGLYIGNGQVIDNHPDRGVSQISLRKFLNGSAIRRVRHFKGGVHKRREVVRRAYASIGRRYHIINFNCEHFVNLAWGLGKKSQQVKVASSILWATVAIWGINKASQ